MTVIGSNISALRAANASTSASSALATSMERLSTGKRINSAKDDAAGLAIASRMTSQIKSMAVAVRNANDGISMAQTAEGALGEVTSMLQRMKELATQSATGTLGTSERKALQSEVTQLTAQIDSISQTTNFNGINLLDGSSKNVKLQTGTNASETVSVSLASVSSDALGLNGFRVEGQLTTGRVGGTLANVAIADIQINGKDAFATAPTATADTAKALADSINGNTAKTGVSAVAYNTVTGGAVASSGVGADELTINGVGVTGGTSEELVKTINRDVAGVTATLKDGKITLSNDTGNAIAIGGTAAGKGGFTAATSQGFVALSSSNGGPISISKGTAGDAADFSAIGLNATSANGAVTGTAAGAGELTSTDDVKINGVQIGNSSEGSAASKAAAINAVAGQTGVDATARTQITLDTDLTAEAADFMINGTIVDLSTAKNTADVVAAINDKGISGVKASTNLDGKLVLTSESGQDIKVEDAGEFTTTITNSDGSDVDIGTAASGQITLSSKGGADITVQGDPDSLTKMGLTSQGGEDGKLAGALSIETQDAASQALISIDKALDQISSTRGDLGAVQNRLEVTVNNLTTTSTNLADAKGRIEDTDFSAETTALAKAQILSQASTAMLSQANQSQQSVLKLLQ
jgi:flagellin